MLRAVYVWTLAAVISYTYSATTEPKVELGTYKQALELTCGDAEPPVAVSWFFNESTTPIAADNKKFELFSENNTLRIKVIDPTVVWPYECERTVDNTTTKMAFVIHVRPYAVQPEKPRNVIQGDPLNLECKAWGVPAPTIEWRHNTTVLVQGEFGGKVHLKISTGSSDSNSIKFPILENGTLRIENIDTDQGGNYTCYVTVVTATWEDSASATTTVNIKDKYAALWPFLGICVEVAILCTIIMIYEKRRAKRIEEEERQEEAAHLNANNDNNRTAALSDDVRQRK